MSPMGAHVHKITYEPLIDTALYVMLLMQANPLLGQVGGGWALEISTFSGPKWNSHDGSMPFHRVQKSFDFQACPRNGFAAPKALRTGPYKP
jgi:hypothetical protein